MSKQLQQEFASEGKREQVKIMLISTPRSVSTALLKCLGSIKGSLAFMEPYVLNTWFGKDRKFEGAYDGFMNPDDFSSFMEELAATNINYGYDVSESSYAWVKDQLEKKYPDKQLLICKDVCYGIRDHKHDLPQGYRYVFLIRNPLLVFPSWKKMHQRCLKVPLEDLNIKKWTEAMIPQQKGSIYKEMSDVYDYVKENRDPSPIILDAEDLLSDPATVIQALFQEIGIPYDDSILQWDASDNTTKEWFVARSLIEANKVGGFYHAAFNSSKFLEPKKLPAAKDLMEDELQFATDAMPYYKRLYEIRHGLLRVC